MSLRLWLQRQLEPPRAPSYKDECALITAAFWANDEKQMRANLKRLNFQVVHNETLHQAALQAVFAGRTLGRWLLKQHRFPEAELEFLKVRKRFCPDWRESATILFFLADSIWGQNERFRAEREALTPLQELLDKAPNDDYTFRLRARLAFYHFNFEAQAQFLEQSFSAPTSEYHSPLTTSQITRQRIDCARAWTRAGYNSRARSHLEIALNFAPTHALSFSAQEQLFFVELDEQKQEEARAVLQRIVELGEDTPQQQHKINVLRALLALHTNDVDNYDAVRETLGPPQDLLARRRDWGLTSRALAKRGDFDEARRLHDESEASYTQHSPEDDYLRGVLALERAAMETTVHLYQGTGDLQVAQSRLTLARSLLRSHASSQLTIQASEIELLALQGRCTEAREKALWIEEMFGVCEHCEATQRGLGDTLLNIYEVCGESEQVLHWGEQLLEKWPYDAEDPAILLTLAKAHQMQGNIDKARELRQQVASGNPTLLFVRIARERLAE